MWIPLSSYEVMAVNSFEHMLSDILNVFVFISLFCLILAYIFQVSFLKTKFWSLFPISTYTFYLLHLIKDLNPSVLISGEMFLISLYLR